MTERLRRVCVVGGAGFIGSHFVQRLLSDPATEQVTVYDNFSSGRDWHLEPGEDRVFRYRLVVHRGEGDFERLQDRWDQFASAPDLSAVG